MSKSYDITENYIVVTGNPVDGFSFHGPFETHEDAVTWADTLDPDWWIAKLAYPVEMEA